MAKKKPAEELNLFHTDTIRGDYGEYRVKKFLSELYGDSLEYAEDKSLNKYYQKAGIDLIIQYLNGAMTTIEVKNDSTVSKNIYFETISQSKPGEEDVPGCMLTTEAENIFYMFEELDVVLIMQTQQLREWVKSYLANGGVLETRTVQNFTYSSQGYLIPIERLMGAHDGWTGVYGMRVIDMQTGNMLNYEELEKHRNLVETILEDGEERYTTREKHWSIMNKQLWKDHDILNYAIKSVVIEFKRDLKVAIN